MSKCSVVWPTKLMEALSSNLLILKMKKLRPRKVKSLPHIQFEHSWWTGASPKQKTEILQNGLALNILHCSKSPDWTFSGRIWPNLHFLPFISSSLLKDACEQLLRIIWTFKILFALRSRAEQTMWHLSYFSISRATVPPSSHSTFSLLLQPFAFPAEKSVRPAYLTNYRF